MTLSAAVDDSEVHKVIGNHQLTSLASGRAWRADKKGCDLSRTVASGVGALKVFRRLNLTPVLLVPWVASPKGQQPRTRHTGPSVRSQARPSDWHDAKLSSVEPAFAGWPC